MIQYLYIDNDFCKAKSIDHKLDGLIMYNLGNWVNDNKDGAIFFAFLVCEY